MMRLNGERGVAMEISSNNVTFDLPMGGNVQFLSDDCYNTVRGVKGAKFIEWMIAGEEALKDILVRINLRRGDLGPRLKKRLISEWDALQKNANKISKIVSKEENTLIEKDSVKEGVSVTVKTVEGKYRKCYPTVNILIPLDKCRRSRTQKFLKYNFKLPVNDAIELAYKVLYWITVTEISESKGPKVAETILGEIKHNT